MELIAKIRAEIERRLNLIVKGLDFFTAEVELRGLLSFLDTLQEPEKPKWDDSDMRYDENELLSRFAFYTYKDEPDVLYLSNLFVEESFRNIGIGTKILAAAEKVAETLGATSICLKVKWGSHANAWYRKNGYGYVAFEDGYDWLEKTLEYMKPKQEPEVDLEKEIRSERKKTVGHIRPDERRTKPYG